MKAYERLIKYAKIYTTSDPTSETVPSTKRQFDLAHILVDEMKEIGIQDVRVDENCYVYGVIPATKGYEDKYSIGFIAHMDTAPAAPGENVNPQLVENYDGKDITLLNGTILSVEKFPHLKNLKGRTLITTDGTTLLGADDKAGIAEILTACERIINENIPHGKICIGFTPDEEIGRGANKFDVKNFGATFAEAKNNISITGAVQFGQGINKYGDSDLETMQILSPFRDTKDAEAKNSTIGTKKIINEAHYFYPFSINPSAYKELVALGVTDGYTEEDYLNFKRTALVAATSFSSNAKEGCQNEFALFVETKLDTYLPNLSEYISFEKADINKIKIECNMLNELEDILNIEIYYNPETTVLESNLQKAKTYNLITKKEV